MFFICNIESNMLVDEISTLTNLMRKILLLLKFKYCLDLLEVTKCHLTLEVGATTQKNNENYLN